MKTKKLKLSAVNVFVISVAMGTVIGVIASALRKRGAKKLY